MKIKKQFSRPIMTNHGTISYIEYYTVVEEVPDVGGNELEDGEPRDLNKEKVKVVNVVKPKAKRGKK